MFTGHGELEALVMSGGMLAFAERRKVCGRFHCADLAASIGIPEGRFDTVASAGAFDITHVPGCGIRESAHFTRPDGHPVQTVRMEGIDGSAFSGEQKSLYVVWVFRRPETSGPRHG